MFTNKRQKQPKVANFQVQSSQKNHRSIRRQKTRTVHSKKSQTNSKHSTNSLIHSDLRPLTSVPTRDYSTHHESLEIIPKFTVPHEEQSNLRTTTNLTPKLSMSTKSARHKFQPLLTASKRPVSSFVNAKFQIVQVKVQPTLPDLVLLPTNSTNPTHSDENDPNQADTSSKHRPPPPTPSSQFLNTNILSNPTDLLDFATNQSVKGNTFLVKRSELENFYNTNHKKLVKQLSSSSHPSTERNNPLLALLPPTIPTTMQQHNDPTRSASNSLPPSQHELQLDYLHKEQQLSLQMAPTTTIQDLAKTQNELREKHFNSTNAKPLELFKTPRKHEIQAILAASKGDVITVRQIIGKSYFDCFDKMGLLPPKFSKLATATNISPNDWGEVAINDIESAYAPGKYKFFNTNDDMNTFFSWVESSFAPDTLTTFRRSNLYQYNIGSQLQKGGGVLHHAVTTKNNYELLTFLLKHGGLEVINQQTSNNSTPLHWASGAGWISSVKLLVDNGADIHATTNSWSVDVFGRDSSQFPLHWAAASGHSDIVEYLSMLSPLSLGVKDEKDNSVLCMAKKGLHFDTMRRIKKSLEDEYVPVRLEIHTVEQNIFFDPSKMGQNSSQNDVSEGGDDNSDLNSDYVDLDHMVMAESEQIGSIHNMSSQII